MARSDADHQKRTLGAVAGLLVLGFALVYHFFPNLLHVTPGPPARRVPGVVGSNTRPMGFESRPQAATAESTNEREAGPPLSLAPSAVVTQRLEAGHNAPANTSTAPAPPRIAALLKRADTAIGHGMLTGGKDSAAALIQRALKLHPGNNRARKALSDLHTRVVAKVQRALAAGDADAASQALDELRQLPHAGDDVAHLQQDLKTLRKVQPLLAQAMHAMQAQPADTADRAQALAAYRRALAIDPDNAVANHGIQRIQQVSLDAALSAAAQNDFASASRALAQAAQINPDSYTLQNVRGRIEGMRRAHAESVLSQADTALDAGNLDLATRLEAKAIKISPDVRGVAAFKKKLSDAKTYASHSPGQVFRDAFLDSNGNGPRMVVIPTGTFMMGSADTSSGHQPDESPQHQVRIDKGLAFQRAEVSVAQFRAFVQSSGYVPESQRSGGSSVYDGSSGTMRMDSQASWKNNYEGRHADADAPVVNVSWHDARAYAQWLSRKTGKTYRLPTEAEYEYAMRGGTQTPYWWGAGKPESKVENLTGSRDRSRRGRRWTNSFHGYGDGYWGPAPVAHFQPNPFGLYDIDGNVSEWVMDCWHQNYTRAPRDGSAWVNPGCSERIVRGGSWGSSPTQDRSAYRLGVAPDTRSGRVGFRVVRVLQE